MSEQDSQAMTAQRFAELDRCVKTYFKDGQLTDASNAAQFVREKGASIGYSYERGWAAADEGEWLWEFAPNRSEPSHAVIRKAIAFFDEMEASADFMVANARTTDEETDGKKLRAHAKRSKQISRIHAMLALAKTDRLIARQLSDFDSHPHLLGCKNGIVDLRSGDFVRGTPVTNEDREFTVPYMGLDEKVGLLITKAVPVDFEPGRVSDLWESTVLDVMGGSADFARFLRDWFGYCLTGDASLQKMVVLSGAGANGKSMVMDTLAEVFGPLAMAANASIFNDPKAGAPDPAGFRLRSKRAVFVDESNLRMEGFSAARMKALTAGGVMTARDLHSSETDDSEFAVTAGFTMSTNFAPDFGGASDDSLWRRVITIPFTQFYTDTPNAEMGHKARDASLPGRVRGELSGVLGWLVAGAVEFYATRTLNVPKDVQSFTEQHREDASKFGAFYRAGTGEGWIVEDPDSWVLKRDAYDAYVNYMHLEMAEERYVLTQRVFIREMDTASGNYGVTPAKRAEGAGWKGLRIVKSGSVAEKEQEQAEANQAEAEEMYRSAS